MNPNKLRSSNSGAPQVFEKARPADRQARLARAVRSAFGAGLEPLESRCLMSASTLGGSVDTDFAQGMTPQSTESLHHALSADDSDRQTRSERKAERAAQKDQKQAERKSQKEQKVRARIEAREQKQAVKAEKKDHKKAPKAGSVEGNQVARLMLVNARTNKEVGALNDGQTIDLSTIGTRKISVRADGGADTKSVLFRLNETKSKTDSTINYALRGGKGSKYRGWNPSAGTHTLTVTPYSKNSARGEAGEAVTVNFTVVKGVKSAPQKPAKPDGTPPRTPPPVTSPAPTPSPNPAPAPKPPPVSMPAPTPPPISTPAPTLPVSTPAPTPTPTPTPTPRPTPSPTPPPAPPVTGDSSNRAPSVSLIDTGITTIAGPAHMMLRADAADADGSVKRVDFFANDTFVGAANGGPWMVSWTNVQPGTYQVTARAYDNEGAVTVSKAQTITVVQPTGGRIINVKPGDSVSSAVRSAQAGDTVLIQPGTYNDTLTLRNSGTADKPITIKAAGAPGSVIIDGGGATRLVADQWVGTGHWTTIQGITFRNCGNPTNQNNAAIKTTDGMRLIDVVVEKADGAGIGVFGDNVVLIRVTARDNGCTGIGGSKISNSMLVDCVSHGNNTKKYSGSFEGGGGKFTRVESLLVEGHHAYDNNGPGIWFDGDNINVTIRGGVFHNNHNLQNSDGSERIGGRGIMLEISGIDSDGNGGIDGQGPILIEDCLTYDNDNASVQVYATANVTLQNNTFINDYIDLKDKREKPYIVKNLTITGNKLKDAHIMADTAVASDYENENIRIDNNIYDSTGKIFRWNGKDYSSVSSVRSALGFEQNGAAGTVNRAA